MSLGLNTVPFNLMIDGSWIISIKDFNADFRSEGYFGIESFIPFYHAILLFSKIIDENEIK